MPTITLSGPKIDVSKKQYLANSMSELVSEVLGIPIQEFILLFEENDPENVAIGGKLLSDRKHNQNICS